MFCRDLALVKPFDGGFFATPLYCRSWGCDVCRPKRRAQVKRQALKGHGVIFVTLTANPAWGDGPLHRAHELVDAWRTFLADMRALGELGKVAYFAVFEATKAGEPHLHILTRAPWIDQEKLSAYMDAWMQAPNVWITKIRSNAQAAFYVAKYLGKKPDKFGTCKRYWQTRDWADKDPPPDREVDRARAPWQIVKHGLDLYFNLAKAFAWPVTNDGDIWRFQVRAPP